MNPLRLTTAECAAIYYGRCYDILVQKVGARRTDRDSFLDAFSRLEAPFHSEYRFQGSLGFGGKFYCNHERVYIGCYSEDETPEIRALIKEVNETLLAFGPPPSPSVQGEISDYDERIEHAANAGVVRGVVIALMTLPPPQDRHAIQYVLRAAGITLKVMEEARCAPTDIRTIKKYLETER